LCLNYFSLLISSDFRRRSKSFNTELNSRTATLPSRVAPQVPVREGAAGLPLPLKHAHSGSQRETQPQTLEAGREMSRLKKSGTLKQAAKRDILEKTLELAQTQQLAERVPALDKFTSS